MLEEKNTVELEEEELEKASGGSGESGNNWTITINCTVGNTPLFVKEDAISLQVSPDTTVSEVKQMINNKCNVDVEAQRLVYIGKELNDSKTLGNLGVSNGSEIFLLVRLRW